MVVQRSQEHLGETAFKRYQEDTLPLPDHSAFSEMFNSVFETSLLAASL
ncbi:MAG: hypothetical protein GU361_01695 [Desulfurococcales archaeon]|nr:hypothetical protein [Desulfurococcales archaeon]